MLKRFFRIVLIGLLMLGFILWFNTFRFSSRQLDVQTSSVTPYFSDTLAEHLSSAIQCPTVSQVGYVDSMAFAHLDSVFRQFFPLVHEQLGFEAVNDHGRLYHWPGQNAQLEPILLLAHLDVVPAEDPEAWTYPPFSGKIADGYIWGRGSLDDKLSAVAILEAVEKLLEIGFQPERGLYLAFGQDEETSGEQGAGAIAEILRSKDLRFAFVLDEGLVILEEALDGLDPPLAMIGIAEKGICTLNLSVEETAGGHASMPPPETTVGVLAKAIDQLQSNPFPARIDGAVSDFFDYVGPEMTGLQKVVMANRWLSKGVLIGSLEGDPAANALIRTTMAPTMVRGGVRSNVLPTRAVAKVNIRILPGETVSSVVDYCRMVINDERVRVEVDEELSYNDPSPVSPVDAYGFQLIQRTTLEIFHNVVVAPSLVVGYTDSRNYIDLSDQVYRFIPVQLTRSDLKRIHGIDERLSVESYLNLIKFYFLLIKGACGD